MERSQHRDYFNSEAQEKGIHRRCFTLKRTLLLIAATILIGLPATAFADTFTFQAPATAPNQGSGGANQVDLDHHRAYTWRIDNVSLGGQAITGATLTFHNISNWDTNPNMLFIHLLDTARQSGIRSFVDASGVPVPVNQIVDNFAGSLFGSNPLVYSNTGNRFLAAQSFTTTPSTFVYTFTAQDIQTLTAFLANGNNVAFGLDPDCHFWNNGITFTITTGSPNVVQPVPEPATLALLGSGLGGLYLKRRRRKLGTPQA